MLGVFATALFYGDSMITPAISVLSAVEGLTTVKAGFEPYVIPTAIGILVGLFAIQSRGTAKVGLLFGPIMLVYFATLAVLGGMQIVKHPDVLVQMLNPLNAFKFYIAEPLPAFIAMGCVVLAVTGAEALYADMGHFGRRPIKFSWLYFVMPALLLNYMGQGAMLLSQDPAQALETVKNPFFFLAPETLRLPLVILATMATIIASQAVISGAFSVTQQAIQLGFIPRLRITHTSEHAAGQIYIPVVNWALMVMVILLVLMFGILVEPRRGLWHCRDRRDADRRRADLGRALLAVEVAAWKAIPLLVALLHHRHPLFRRQPAEGARRRLVPAADRRDRLHPAHHLGQGPQADDRPDGRGGAADRSVHQVRRDQRHPGSRNGGVHDHSMTGVPHALLHNLKHNKVLHERVMLLTVRIEDVPFVVEERADRRPRIMAPASSGSSCAMASWRKSTFRRRSREIKNCGPQCKMMDTSFFLARQTLIASARPGMAIWREKLFAWMLRNAESAMEFFKLPTNRVVELGSQVEI